MGVVDTGIDAAHPDLRGKISAAVDQQDPSDSTGPATTDQVGHGTHVASLACAGTNNGIGMAGAGFDCKLVIEKTDFTDSSIAASIVDAADHHVGALNMSFGPAQVTSAPAPESEVRALQYAAARDVVLVAAAADSPGTEQGDPGNVLQPSGTGPDINKGLGLDVTAAAYDGARASFSGSGTEISLAAYGALNPDAGGILGLGPPPGIFGAFPANSTEIEGLPDPCGCRTTFRGDNRYAYLQGTSMATPQVAATAAMMRALNPYATVSDILHIIKRTAQRPAGAGWRSEPGLGHPRWRRRDQGRADGRSPGAGQPTLRPQDRPSPDVRAHGGPDMTSILPAWSRQESRAMRSTSGHAAAARAASPAPAVTRSASTVARESSYSFSVVAVDRAGNRQHQAARATTRVTRTAR